MGKRSGSRPKQQPRIADHISDSEDEEISEDEAFNSEDERLYGAFFQQKSSTFDSDNDDEEASDGGGGEDDESDEDDDHSSYGDDQEGDGGQYMLNLLNKLDPPKAEVKDLNTLSHVEESEFAASVLGKQELTLTDLMNGLEDSKGFGIMQKQFREVVKGKTTNVPLPKVISNRTQRKVAYSKNKIDISQWIEAVQQNRQAESLDFRPKQRENLTKTKLVDKFTPTTLFEKELHTALQEAGQQDERAMLKHEEALLREDDLGANEITLEEYEKRRGELAKMRALLFYHEQKRHHINKIKSKKYRRIRKKQRERMKESQIEAQLKEDPELEREMEEKEEMERMKERMTLAHKNTSKWAKRILKRGKTVDLDMRRALSAQLKRGDDLRKKQLHISPENDGGSEDENLVESARKVLGEIDEQSEDAVSGKGLFQLSFMRKGIEKQRERAKEEARQLLRELEDHNRDDKHSHNSDSEGNQALAQKSRERKKTKKVSTQSELKTVLTEGKLVASTLELGNSDTIAVSGAIYVDLDNATKIHDNGKTQKAVSEHTSAMVVQPVDNTKTVKYDGKHAGKGNSVKTVRVGATRKYDSQNPWLEAEGRESRSAKKTAVVDIGEAAGLLTEPAKDEKDEAGKDEHVRSSKAVALLSQEELVRRAFATPTEDEIDEEFAGEKAAVEERDDPTRKLGDDKPKTSNGWGSWTGLGAPKPKFPKRFPKKLQLPAQKMPKRKRKDEQKPHVIISEKRQKKTATKFQIANIPHPYKNRDEFERAMSGGIGGEWNVTSATKTLIRPRVVTRTGKIIQPISKRAKKDRAPAKF